MSTQEQDKPGVIAPPPLILLACLLIGAGLEYLWPTAFAPLWMRWILGGGLVVIGAVTIVAVVRRFRRAGTHVEPYKPTLAIVIDGPFRYTRNPIYAAGTAVHIGIAIAADSLWILLMLLPWLALVHYGVIAREERYLEGKFGQEYLDYKSRVRRWI